MRNYANASPPLIVPRGSDFPFDPTPPLGDRIKWAHQLVADSATMEEWSIGKWDDGYLDLFFVDRW